MSAVDYWRNRVEAHHAQSLRAQDRSQGSEDFWRPFASGFRADPRRTDDPLVDRLAREVDPDSTLLDVGGGAGRLALSLALRCANVTVVEPSDSMVAELRDAVREGGIENVNVVPQTWEDAQVKPADIVLCAHVVYGVADIGSFVRKLDSHAGERVLMLVFMASPQSHLSPIWEAVHGEERVNMPALPELLRVLWEMEIYPDIEMFGASEPQVFESREAAIEQLRQRLYITPDTEQDRRLKMAVQDLLEETPDGLVVPGARRRRQGLIAWRPAVPSAP